MTSRISIAETEHYPGGVRQVPMTKQNATAPKKDPDGYWRVDGRYVTQWRVDDATRGLGARRWCVQLVSERGEVLDRLGGERTFLAKKRAQAEVDKRNAKLFAHSC